jgi:Tfp pilus assembly protein PilN
MKAVNLIPAEEAASSGRKPAFATCALLVALALLVAMSAVYTLAGRAVQQKRSDVAAVSAQADAAESRAKSLQTYADFANLRSSRAETVKKLATSRFDWSVGLREVARTLPSGTWVTSLRATTNPSVPVDGSADSLRTSMAVPAIEAAGCARTQDLVARMIVALRGIAGVQRVSLSSSTTQVAAAGGDASSATQGCGSGPKFSLTIFYKALEASTTAVSGGTTP